MKLNAMEASVLVKCQNEPKEIIWLSHKFLDEYMHLKDFKFHIGRMASKGLITYHGEGEHLIKISSYGKKCLQNVFKRRV